MNHSRADKSAEMFLPPAYARKLVVTAGLMVVLASLVLAFRVVLPVFSFPHALLGGSIRRFPRPLHEVPVSSVTATRNASVTVMQDAALVRVPHCPLWC